VTEVDKGLPDCNFAEHYGYTKTSTPCPRQRGTLRHSLTRDLAPPSGGQVMLRIGFANKVSQRKRSGIML